MTFFFDRCIGVFVPRRLQELGLPVEVHQDHFPEDCRDDEWLAAVGSRGWLAISKDGKFHYRKSELAALQQYQMGCFYMWKAHMMPLEKIGFFLEHHQKLVQKATSTDRPFIYRVHPDGKLQKLKIDRSVSEVAIETESE